MGGRFIAPSTLKESGGDSMTEAEARAFIAGLTHEQKVELLSLLQSLVKNKK